LNSIAEENDDSVDDNALKEFLSSNLTFMGDDAIADLSPLGPYEVREESSNHDDLGPMVNVIPDVSKALRRSVTGASVEVLSDSSESGELGEFSDVGQHKNTIMRRRRKIVGSRWTLDVASQHQTFSTVMKVMSPSVGTMRPNYAATATIQRSSSVTPSLPELQQQLQGNVHGQMSIPRTKIHHHHPSRRWNKSIWKFGL
jgi:hypothetical protein